MPGDPKECRLHAMHCIQLAEEAINPDENESVELEDAQALINTLNALEIKTDSASPSGDGHDPLPSQ